MALRRRVRGRRVAGANVARGRRLRGVEWLERRDLLASFAYSEVFAEATLTDLLTGESQVVHLRGSATGDLSETVGNLSLEDRSQQLLTLSLSGFESERFGEVQVTLAPATTATGFIVERRNDVPGQVELPATSQFDVDFQMSLTTYDDPAPQSVTLRPSAPVRIEAGVGELPAGINDTFRLRNGAVNLAAASGDPPQVALSNLALTFRPLMATLQGQKFHDFNANGVRDPGETGVNGWAIAALDLNDDRQAVAALQFTHDIDFNQDNVIDPETESGWYVFSDLPPGTYYATELTHAGWAQTAPQPTTIGALAPSSGPGSGWVADIAAQRGSWRAAALVGIDWPDDGNLDGQVDEQVLLSGVDGSVRLGWQASSASTLGGPLDRATAELSRFTLQGTSSHGGLILSGGDGTLDFAPSGLDHSAGRFQQVPGDALLADGSFDLDFSLRVGATGGEGGVLLQPTAPLTIASKLDRLPLDGFVFSASTPTALIDGQSQTTAQIVDVKWVFFRDRVLEGESGYGVPLGLGRSFSNANFGGVDRPAGPYGFDFGDAPDSLFGAQYPTYLANNGARHAINGRLFLGSSVDAEDDGISEDSALGDDQVYSSDASPIDDEDGVAFHGPAVAGQTLSVDVFASRAGKLDAWVDFNADGDWNDAGEQVFVSQSATAGLNALSFNVPAGAAVGSTTMARFRLSSAGGLSYVGLAADGEVEDYALSIRATAGPNRDYGDATSAPPANYPTLLVQGGASHLIGPYYLGNFVDGELDGAASSDFSGDDFSSLLDDEDGVRIVRSLVLGQTSTIAVNASQAGYLNAWIDFNQDGDWNDPNEHVFDAVALDGGTNLLDLTLPDSDAGALGSPQTAARFRFTASPLEGRTPGGSAQSGEVEDYTLPVLNPIVFLTSGAWTMAVGPSQSDSGAFDPGILGLTTSPNRNDALDLRFTQLASQSFYYRIGSTGGESSLSTLRMTNVQVDYAGASLQVEYGDVAYGDKIHVLVRYTLSATDLGNVTIDEQVLITNLTFQPLNVAWFALADVDLNGDFGRFDAGRVDLIDAYVQTGQFGSTFQQLVTSPPAPDAYDVTTPGALVAAMFDGSPTELTSSPAFGVSTAPDDTAAALQWNLQLGITDDDRSALLNLSKVFSVVPVVAPDGSQLTGVRPGEAYGGISANASTSSFHPVLSTASSASSAGGGAAAPVACRGECILDPAAAIGFDFTATTDNGFASVQLPFGFGDDQYVVQTPNGLGGWNNHPVAAGDEYSFAAEFPGGLSHFRVLGIEVEADVDPLDPRAFPTLVRFAVPLGEWNVRMTAVPERVYVDPLGDFTEEVNVDAFGRLELGDIVTYHRGRGDEVTGLLFGQTAFRTRAEALASLQANGFEGLTLIIETTGDMGDAPAPYPTLVADDGPVHGVGGSLWLGAAVDDDADGQPDANANGDDASGVDDEDGVALLNNWTLGGTAQLQATATGAGLLSAWVDWNQDGDWSDAGEQVFVNQLLVAGANNLSFAVPATAAVGPNAFARFRFSTASDLAPTGPAPDGEVEDYRATVSARPELQGRVFADINNNSRRDAGEPYVNGRVVELVNGANQVIATATTLDVDLNGDSAIDPETERGVYRFLDVAAGTYQVREVVPGDWLQTAPDFGALMNGEQNFPSSFTSGNGFTAFGWDAATNTLSFTMDFDGATGSSIALKLYDGAAGTNGVEIRDLSAAAGAAAGFVGPVRGSVVLTNGEAAKLAAGQLYVSLLTTAFPSGELRGQIGAANAHRVTLGANQVLAGLDFGAVSATPRTSVYPASQGQVALQLPGGGQELIQMVGSSTMQMFIASDGSTGDVDLDGLDDAGLELTALALRGYGSMGRVDVSLRPVQRTFGRVEEVNNSSTGKLELSPFVGTGVATSYLDVFFQVTVTNGSTVAVYHTATAARVVGSVTADPMALGETLSGGGSLELLDASNAPTGIFLTSQSYTPSPLRPWHNPGNRLDVDNSGEVVPLDALLVINELNSPAYSTNNALPAPVDPNRPPPPLFDVSASGSIEPLDALLVINFLNGVGGEGESASARLATALNEPPAATESPDAAESPALPWGAAAGAGSSDLGTRSTGLGSESAIGTTTPSGLAAAGRTGFDAAWVELDESRGWWELLGDEERTGAAGDRQSLEESADGSGDWSAAVDALLAAD